VVCVWGGRGVHTVVVVSAYVLGGLAHRGECGLDHLLDLLPRDGLRQGKGRDNRWVAWGWRGGGVRADGTVADLRV
jgi:hypothetical protein